MSGMVMVEFKTFIGDVFVLYDPAPQPIMSGDLHSVFAGCNKRSTTCKTKFQNFDNFISKKYYFFAVAFFAAVFLGAAFFTGAFLAVAFFGTAFLAGLASSVFGSSFLASSSSFHWSGYRRL